MVRDALRACVQCGRAHSRRSARCQLCQPVISKPVYRKRVARESAAKRGYDHRWRRAAREFLAEEGHHVCCLCNAAIATQVDHIVPHRGDHRLFWDRKNWQPACRPCHSRKTRRGK